MLAFVIIIILIFGLTALRGAPYVPAHSKHFNEALGSLKLPAGSLVIDLGSGDGSVLKLAARRGLKAVGYEINPILCAVSWLRCLRYKDQIKILWRDFWFVKFPPETRVVYVFAGGPFMKKLAKKLDCEIKNFKHDVYVISYGFEIPEKRAEKVISGMLIYKY